MKAQLSQPQTQNTDPQTVGAQRLHVLAAIVLSLALTSAIQAADWTSTLILPSNLPPAATNNVAAMAEFGGDLYVGVGGFQLSGGYVAVLRLSHAGCKIWDDVTPSFASGTQGDAMAMAVFGNQLYVGTRLGEIFRTPDGQKWTKMTGYPGGGGFVMSMVLHGSHLYVNNGATIYRSSDGTAWTPVVGPSPAKHSYNFGAPLSKATIESFTAFNGSLWAGVGRDNVNGFEVWTSSDGINWTESLDVTPVPMGSNAYIGEPGHVPAMQAYKGHLYVATYHGKEMYRTDGVTGWKSSMVPMTGDGDMLRMAVHNNTLYMGRSYFMSPAPTSSDYLLYSSTNGTSWSPVPGSNLGADREMVTSLLSSAGNLWVGFKNDQAGAEVFAYGQVDPCQINDLGKSWEKGGKGKAGLPKNWIDLCDLGKCPKPRRHPDTLIHGFASALQELELPEDAQRYQQETLEQMEIVAELVAASAELQNMATEIEDPAERQLFLDEASQLTADAMAAAQDVTESIAAAAGQPSPMRFSDGFEAGIDGWTFEGGFAPTELNGEGVLAGEGWSIASAECEPAEDQMSLTSFRARMDGGMVLAQAAATDTGAIWVGLQDGEIVVATSEGEGEEPRVIAAAPWSADPDAWHLIQAEVDGESLSVSVNTHQVLSVEIDGERQPMVPAFYTDGGWAALDDAALAGWSR